MDELIQKLKEEIIEVLNLEEMEPEDIKTDDPLFGDGLGFEMGDMETVGHKIEGGVFSLLFDFQEGESLFERFVIAFERKIGVATELLKVDQKRFPVMIKALFHGSIVVDKQFFFDQRFRLFHLHAADIQGFRSIKIEARERLGYRKTVPTPKLPVTFRDA